MKKTYAVCTFHGARQKTVKRFARKGEARAHFNALWKKLTEKANAAPRPRRAYTLSVGMFFDAGKPVGEWCLTKKAIRVGRLFTFRLGHGGRVVDW